MSMNRNLRNNSANYEAPQVEIIEVKVEKGFAASPNIEPLGPTKDELEW